MRELLGVSVMEASAAASVLEMVGGGEWNCAVCARTGTA